MNQARIFTVEGMHCGSCVARITNTVKSHAAVQSVTVDLVANQMEVRAEASLSNADIEALVASAGDYQAMAKTEKRPVLAVADQPSGFWAIYKPLLLLALMLAVVPAVALGTEFSLHEWMRWFMAGFFLSFSFFKLLDVRAFANSFQMYDWIAKVVPAWGLAYPFVELALGLAYAANLNPQLTHSVTLGLMLVGAGGVIQSNLQKKAIRCACLGTVFNLPMSTVTVVEDLSMAAMAAWMLASH